ncbi:uncharacterized protein LOC117171036 [Belonocnema kinseyi]|uniref:uncharacterized protein LOC117171036 n=1 Tax=Belonocnema kinseyi TaxID=2817044 RepID=UPI00143D6662|nr:uncharacterized protein LOC117171036 [Belonocnema kinseyi]
MVAMLTRLMPNITGPRSSKQRILMSVANSIFFYGAEVWADALKVKCRRNRLLKVQYKGALRVACAYRLVSVPAVLVIAGCIQVDLQAAERKRIYEAKIEGADRNIYSMERSTTPQKWQQKWREETRGRWTARLIGEVQP